MTIRVFQGEREMATDNKMLGSFDLTGIPAAARGMPQIDVTFDIDANGIVSVQAKDKATDKEQQIQIQANGGLSDADIQKMVKEAEANAGADKKRREFVETKNRCDAMTDQLQKTLQEHGQMLSAQDKAAAEAAISAARLAMDSDDQEKLVRAVDQLGHAAIAIDQAAHKARAAAGDGRGGGPARGPSGPTPGDDVVDAEFEEVGGDRGKAA